MKTITKLGAATVVACAASLGSTSANAWWNDHDYYDRWHGGPWYGGGYPGYGWGGYPGYGWGRYPGYGDSKTIIVMPQVDEKPVKPEPKLPR